MGNREVVLQLKLTRRLVAAADHQHVTRIQPFGGQVSNQLVSSPSQWSFAGPTTWDSAFP